MSIRSVWVGKLNGNVDELSWALSMFSSSTMCSKLLVIVSAFNGALSRSENCAKLKGNYRKFTASPELRSSLTCREKSFGNSLFVCAFVLRKTERERKREEKKFLYTSLVDRVGNVNLFEMSIPTIARRDIPDYRKINKFIHKFWAFSEWLKFTECE